MKKFDLPKDALDQLIVGAMGDAKELLEFMENIRSIKDEDLNNMDGQEILKLLPEKLHRQIFKILSIHGGLKEVKNTKNGQKGIEVNSFMMKHILLGFIESLKKSDLAVEGGTEEESLAKTEEQIKEIQDEIAKATEEMMNIEMNQLKERRAKQIELYTSVLKNEKSKVGDKKKAQKILLYINSVDTFEVIGHLLDRKFDCSVKELVEGKVTLREAYEKASVNLINYLDSSKRKFANPGSIPTIFYDKLFNSNEEVIPTIQYFWLGFANVIFNRPMHEWVYLFCIEFMYNIENLLRGKLTEEEVNKMKCNIETMGKLVEDHINSIKQK